MLKEETNPKKMFLFFYFKNRFSTNSLFLFLKLYALMKGKEGRKNGYGKNGKVY